MVRALPAVALGATRHSLAPCGRGQGEGSQFLSNAFSVFQFVFFDCEAFPRPLRERVRERGRCFWFKSFCRFPICFLFPRPLRERAGRGVAVSG
jgi:hypothetical protein